MSPNDDSIEVVKEAARQRQLSMPVFVARSDMLLGDSFRLLVLNDDQEVQRYTMPDFPGVNETLSGLGIDVPADAVPGVATAPEPPSGSVAESIIADATPSSGEPGLRGGRDGEARYFNSLYGFEAQFPANWAYRVPDKNDGAIALAPSGSRLDMRVWSVLANDIRNPQQYIDKTLEGLAKKHKTRIDVSQKFRVTDRGVEGLDVTYVYPRPISPGNPARGSLLHRGRIQVFVDGDYVKAAMVEAPSGEFMASIRLIDSFIRSFKLAPSDVPMSNPSSL